MAYKTAFYFEFESDNGTAFRLDIKKNNYTGTAKKRNLGRAPVLSLGKNGAINGSSLDIWAECTTDGEFAVLYTSSPYEYLVELRQGSTVIWQGYVSPELYSEPDIAPPYDVNIVATDGLGELKQHIVESGIFSRTDTLRAVIQELLSPTKIVATLTDLVDMYAKPLSSAAQINILDCKVDMGHLEGETYYDALQKVLDSMHATIRINNTAAVLLRENDHYAQNDTDELTSEWWPVGQLTSEILPAKRKVSVKSEDHIRDMVINPNMSESSAGWSLNNYGLVPSWYPAADGNPAYINVRRYSPPSGSQEYGDKWGTISQTIKVGASGSDARFALSANFAIGRLIGLKPIATIVVRTTDASPYYLHELDDDGVKTYEWTRAAGAINVALDSMDNVNFEAVFNSDGVADEIVVEIGCYADPAEYAGVDLSMRVHRVSLVQNFNSKGVIDVLKLNNGARGEADELLVSFNGRDIVEGSAFVPMATSAYGTLMNASYAPITNVYTSEHGRLSLMQTIARDYAMSVALPRLKKKGVLNVPPGQRPPLIGFGDYLLETYSWNLVAAELDMEMVHFPAASLTVESEVIKDLPKDYTSGGTGSSSGGGGGTGGTTDYNALTNKPSINGVALQGDLDAEVFGLSMTAAPRLKYSDLPNGAVLRVHHPLCNVNPKYEVILMHYAKRNRRITKQRSILTRKGWSWAGSEEKIPLVFSSVRTGEYQLGNHVGIAASAIRRFIVGNYCRLHSVSSRADMQNLGADDFAAAFHSNDGFYGWPIQAGDDWKGKRRKRFGIAIRWENPEFASMVDTTRPLSDDTQMIQGVPRYLYTGVAPLTIVISNEGVLGFEM